MVGDHELTKLLLESSAETWRIGMPGTREESLSFPTATLRVGNKLEIGHTRVPMYQQTNVVCEFSRISVHGNQKSSACQVF